MTDRLRPTGLLAGTDAVRAVAHGQAHWLAGGPIAFTLVDRLRPDGSRDLVSAADVPAAWIDAVSAPRAAGFSGCTQVMGVVNVTPDSFSDGDRWFDAGRAIAHGEALRAAGAAILDVGGESTRPGATPVTVEEEIQRTVPVVRALAAGGPVSIDTRNAATMRAALDAGATMVNDVSALGFDPDALSVAAATDVPVVLMHMRGTPQTMLALDRYDGDPVWSVIDELSSSIDRAVAAGVARSRLLVDPGLGFAKSNAHSVQVLATLTALHALGLPILVGASRKRFIAHMSRGEPAGERLAGSLAAVLSAAAQGVQLVRVHDVAETVQALAVARGALP